MNKKKISIILPNLRGGGAEKNYLMLANIWSKKNFEIEFVLLEKEGIFVNKINNNIKIHNLNVKKYRYSFFKIFKYLINNKSDLIIVNLWPLTSITLFLNLLLFNKNRIIVHDHQILSKSYSDEFNNNRKYLSISISLTYNMANGIIAVSNTVKNDLIYLGVKSNKIKVINNPIIIPEFIKKFNDDQIKKMWGSKNKFKVLSIGSFKYEKDFETLIKSISLIKDNRNISVVILGEGKDRFRIESLIKELNLQNIINLPGFKENVNDYYSSADLFISSSIHEGFGNVIADALSYGIKIISSNSGGSNDILCDGKYGDMFNPRDYVTLSNLIVKNIKYKITYNQINKNKERALSFDIQKISNEYINFILNVI